MVHSSLVDPSQLVSEMMLVKYADAPGKWRCMTKVWVNVEDVSLHLTVPVLEELRGSFILGMLGNLLGL